MDEFYDCVHSIKFLSRCWFRGPLVAFHWQAMFHVGLFALFAQYVAVSCSTLIRVSGLVPLDLHFSLHKIPCFDFLVIFRVELYLSLKSQHEEAVSNLGRVCNHSSRRVWVQFKNNVFFVVIESRLRSWSKHVFYLSK